MSDPVTTNYSWTKPTVGADSGTWGGLLNANLDGADTVVAGIAQSFLARPVLSTAGSSASFSVAAGTVVDSATLYPMVLAASITKTTSAWAVGSGNGALDTGSIANATWYHAYLIRRPDTGVVDVLVSTSATSPTLPVSYTQYRRIGAMLTDGSAHWTKFRQVSSWFEWSTPQAVTVTTPSSTPATATLVMPLGIKLMTRIRVTLVDTSMSPNALLVFSTDLDTQVALTPLGNAQMLVGASAFQGAQIDVIADTARQVKYVSTAAMTMNMNTVGWFDPL